MTASDSFEVKQGQWWLFVGASPTDGGQTKHMVVDVEDGVSTWSDPFTMQSARGWSWNGTLDQFLKEFKPI